MGGAQKFSEDLICCSCSSAPAGSLSSFSPLFFSGGKFRLVAAVFVSSVGTVCKRNLHHLPQSSPGGDVLQQFFCDTLVPLVPFSSYL